MILKTYIRIFNEFSKKYICIIEYHSPNPVKINHRNEDEALFKRDFCGELMDMFPDLELVDYGFIYKRDPVATDEVNWFLLKN
ncbi:MAG: hypothetical protein LBD03_04700 [Methanobrevibacter sp.]|jgi:hypothetical protein|nr:hypothetical protein [Candidatus Methanovirga procula]